MTKTLASYSEGNCKRNVIDRSIQAAITEQLPITLYLHLASIKGEILNCVVVWNHPSFLTKVEVSRD